MADTADIIETLLREAKAGRRAALCVIVGARGSTPQPAGVMVCVDHAAQLTGTLGGGCVEADVRRQAHQLLSAGKSGLISFVLDNDFGYDDGMICGGRLDIAVDTLSARQNDEPYRQALKKMRAGQPASLPVRIDTEEGTAEYRVRIEAEPKLVIAGAGHISRIFAELMVPLGFTIDVIDDRSEYANQKRFAPPIRTTAGDIAPTLADWPIDEDTYIVIVTRGHKHDEQVLQAVLDSPAKYIGMIGSRRKVKVVFNDLRHAGASEQQLERVHAPIGLDIASVTTQEIAVSIAAELVSVRRKNHRGVVEGPFPVPPPTA